MKKKFAALLAAFALFSALTGCTLPERLRILGAPKLAVLFGPSDSRVWAPPGALVLETGPDMRGATPDEAFARIAAFLRDC